MDRYYQTIAIIMPGQINIHSAFGKIIYDLSKRLDVINIVEVGTWNGEGSTQCILRAIDNSKRFYTIESKIALDDCNCRKNKLNIKDLKEDNSFSLLCENLNERHGWAVFEKL